MFAQLFNDIKLFISNKLILIIFIFTQSVIFYNQYNLYNENKNFEKFGKIAVISNPYQRILPNEDNR